MGTAQPSAKGVQGTVPGLTLEDSSRATAERGGKRGVYPTRQAYREAWGRAPTEDPPMPLNLDIELASVCDLRCPFCFIPNPKFEEMIREKSEDGRPRARLMPTELALRLIDEAAELGVPALKFNWRGESTLHPEYSRILSYARGKEVSYPVHESSMILGGCHNEQSMKTRPAFFDLLINSNFNFKEHALDGVMAATKVMVSLDSCAPATHAKMRVGADYNRVIENIREVIRRKHPNVWIRRVVCDLNKEEDFYSDCDRTFDVRVDENGGERYHVSQHMVFDRNQLERHALCGLDLGKVERTYCTYPSTRLVVSSAGLVMPCCLALYENLIVGDLNKQTIMEVWSGEPIKKLREKLRSARTQGDMAGAPEACRKCESWMAYDTPHRKYVGDIEITRSDQQVEQLAEIEAAAGPIPVGGY